MRTSEWGLVFRWPVCLRLKALGWLIKTAHVAPDKKHTYCLPSSETQGQLSRSSPSLQLSSSPFPTPPPRCFNFPSPTLTSFKSPRMAVSMSKTRNCDSKRAGANLKKHPSMEIDQIHWCVEMSVEWQRVSEGMSSSFLKKLFRWHLIGCLPVI